MNNSQVLEETRRWLTYAQRDLDAAKTLIQQPENFTQQICFLPQQAAEKALKAALIFAQIDFPFRHDLDLLRNLLPEDWQTRCEHPKLSVLTEWAVEARYPTLAEDPTDEDAQQALAQAEAVLEAIQRDLADHGLS